MSYKNAKMIYEDRQRSGTEGNMKVPKPQDYEPEKFAVMAKDHTEKRLLGMKVKLVLEFCDDRGNLYGQVFLEVQDKKLNIAPSLVIVGLAAVVPWQAKKLSGELLMRAQEQARVKKQ